MHITFLLVGCALCMFLLVEQSPLQYYFYVLSALVCWKGSLERIPSLHSAIIRNGGYWNAIAVGTVAVLFGQLLVRRLWNPLLTCWRLSRTFAVKYYPYFSSCCPSGTFLLFDMQSIFGILFLQQVAVCRQCFRCFLLILTRIMLLFAWVEWSL